ncbi:hypothetical protein KP509_14G038700 [Ceratopteris richardii]|nr:hypothetical protein KP509_14G038700 [Ceratopteris richardii]
MQARTQQEEELLWEDLFSNPSDWQDCRRRKRTSLHPDFRHKGSKAPLWLNSMFKPHWVDPRLAVPGPENPLEEVLIREHCVKEEIDLAMDALCRMDHNGFTPSDALYITILKACSKCNSLLHAITIHAHVIRQSTDLSELLKETLIITFAKCGGLVHAYNLLEKVSLDTVNTWEAVIDASVKHGRDIDALNAFYRMQMLNVAPNPHIYASLLKACSNLGNLEEGRWLHTDGEIKGFASGPLNAVALMDMYSKCGNILDVENIFLKLLQGGVSPWNAMLSAYVQQECWEKAILAYRQMQEEGVTADMLTYTTVLRACSLLGEEETFSLERQSNNGFILDIGRGLHSDIQQNRLLDDVLIGSALIMMYGKCGSILEAINVFEKYPELDDAPWSALISAYVQQGDGAKALVAYTKLHECGYIPDVHMFVNCMKACINIIEKEDAIPGLSLEIGEALYEDSLCRGFAVNMLISNTLVNMYGKCGNIMMAEKVFVGLPQRDLVSWNAMLSVYVQHGEVFNAFFLYMQMISEGIAANAVSFVLILQACGILAEHENLACRQLEQSRPVSIQIGHAFHAVALKEGHGLNVHLCNSLITMYGKCGNLAAAEAVFDSTLAVDVVSWNAMLSSYVENHEAGRALQFYSKMVSHMEYPNKLTYVIALQACIALADQEGQSSKAHALDIGHALYTDILLEGFFSDKVIYSTLVSMYGMGGAVDDAEAIFNKLGPKDLILCNAMLSSYSEQGHDERALHLLNEMEKDILVDEVTFVCALQVCSRVGSIHMCRHLYFKIISAGLDLSSNLINTLIHAFGHCACSRDAEAVFFQRTEPYRVAWNAWISSYAQEGDFGMSAIAFQNMQMAGIMPDAFTYLSLLYICSHSGLVQNSLEAFESMSKEFHLCPSIKHYAAMVDVLGRAGNLKKVEDILSLVPTHANLPLWLSLLGSCRTHGNLELAKDAFKQAMDLQPTYAAAYVLISNICVLGKE